ncbi:MAG: response regulator receiver [Phycisphaerales bacterium]|nr:response regulator receiver [Phycisphaerales bacterium]
MGSAVRDVDVLLVDDDMETCRLMLRILNASKFTADCVHSGIEALSWLGEKRPAVVFLDVSMPGLSGLEVLRLIRADPDKQNLAVFFHSALDAYELNAMAAQYGADGTLLKGRYEISQIVGIVNRFINPS